MRYDHEAAKKVKLAAMNTKKTTRRSKKEKKTTSEDLMKLDDTSDSEVALDSLGSFFVHLIDNDCYQEEAEASHAGDEEVIVLSSGSESLPKQKTRQASRKVRFSHPLAYLDPNFIVKKQQHEARRTTWNSGGRIVSSGLPNTPARRKRRPEVSTISDLSYPKAGFFRQSLNPFNSNYQGTSHSSPGDSMGTHVPAFKPMSG